jgi:hypothetical protein
MECATATTGGCGMTTARCWSPGFPTVRAARSIRKTWRCPPVRGFCARADVVLVDQVCDQFESSTVYLERPGIIFEFMTSIEFHSARKGYRP